MTDDEGERRPAPGADPQIAEADRETTRSRGPQEEQTQNPAREAEARAVQIRDGLNGIGALAAGLFSQSLAVVVSGDAAAEAEVAAKMERLREAAAALETYAINVLALRQPRADELRQTIATLKIVSTLERIGRLGRGVARRSRLADDHSADSRAMTGVIEDAVLTMGRMAHQQIVDAMAAHIAGDPEAALGVWRRDIEIDEVNERVFQTLMREMSAHPRFVSRGVQLMFIAKSIERVGDHTTFIAEMTHYVTLGRKPDAARPKKRSAFSPNLSS